MRTDFERLAHLSTDGYFRDHFDDGLVYVSAGFTDLAGRPGDRLTSNQVRLHKLLHEEDRREFQALVRQLADQESEAGSAVVRMQRPDGSTVWVELFLIAAFDDSGAVVGVDGVARDVSEHLEVADMLSRRSLEQSALLDAQRVLLTTLDLDRSVERIVDRARELLEARHSALFLLNSETGEVLRRGKGRPEDERIWQSAKPLISGVTEAGRTLRVDSVGEDGAGASLAAVLPEGGSVLAAPLKYGEGTLGALAVIGQAGQYTDQDLTFLEALSHVASLALANSRAFQAMERLASVDGLTGAYNRRFFEVNLPPEVERAQRMTYPISMLMIDIDELKQINDQHGHVAGDQALRHVVELVRSRIRETDWVARYGGDEFVVVLPGCPPEHLKRLGQGLLDELRERPIEGMDEAVRAVSSIGAVSARGRRFTGKELCAVADEAERSAKAAGGDQLVIRDLTADHMKPGTGPS